jgi:dCTP deaminase
VILTGDEIRRMVEAGRIVIDPFDPANLGPNSCDVTLSDELLEYVPDAPAWHDHPCAEGFALHPLDMAKDNPTRKVWIPEEGMVLQPGRLYLGCTRERVGSSIFVPWLDGRSSVARLGVQVHLTAGRGDLGFVGPYTLEITAVHPVRVYAGVRIAQVSFFSAWGERGTQYRGKYGGAGCAGPQASRMYMDFQRKGEERRDG